MVTNGGMEQKINDKRWNEPGHKGRRWIDVVNVCHKGRRSVDVGEKGVMEKPDEGARLLSGWSV